MRVADQEAVVALQSLLDPRDLGGRLFARKTRLVLRDRAHWRARPIAPDRIDRIARRGRKFRLRGLAGGREAANEIGRVQTRVVTDPFALLEDARQPLGRRLFGHVQNLVHRTVDLRLRLLRVTPIDEERGPVF